MKRIQLGNTVFEGENNAYLLGGETTTLVDTAVAIPEVRSEFETGLARHGVAMADVDAVVLTHWHPDHAGLAGEIQAASGADVFVHEADAPLVDGRETPLAADPELQRDTFDRWGMPEAPRDRLQSFFASVTAELSGRHPDVTTFVDGDRIEVDGAELEAVHLPGHSAGLTAFAFDPRDVPDHEPVAGPADTDPEEAFTGDAVLPRYTPNVGGADVRVAAPLADYAASLARVVDRDWDAAHPGHRDRIDEPSRRAATILDHHRHRTRRVVDVLDRLGPLTAWETSAELFGDLEAIHILHGPGEAFAHLEHLVNAGVVERDGTRYRLLADAVLDDTDDSDAHVGLDELFPTTRLDGVVDGADA